MSPTSTPGYPPKGQEKRGKQMSMYATNAEYQAIDQVADVLGVSKADLIRDLVLAGLKSMVSAA